MPGVSVRARWKPWPFCFILLSIFSLGWGFVPICTHADARSVLVADSLCCFVTEQYTVAFFFFRCNNQLIEVELIQIDNDSADSFLSVTAALFSQCTVLMFSYAPFLTYLKNIFSRPSPAGLSECFPSHLFFLLSLHRPNHYHKLVIWQEMAISLARLFLWCCWMIVDCGLRLFFLHSSPSHVEFFAFIFWVCFWWGCFLFRQ